MDGNNWRATQAEPNLVDAPDWRTQLQPEFREGIVNNIMDTLKRLLSISSPEGLLDIEKIAVRFEEKIYHASPSQADYLRKISLKMLVMEATYNPADQVRWTDKMDEVLTTALIEDVTLRGKRANNDLKPVTYTIVAEKVTRECGVQISVLHVKNRLKPMKKQYLLARAAINSSGFGIQWDGDNKWLDVEKSSWIKYCKNKSRGVKSLRRKFFPLYDALWLILGDEGAGGDNVFGIDPNVRESPSVNTESRVGFGDDKEDLGNNIEGASVDPEPTCTQAQSSRGQRQKRKRKDLLEQQ